MHLGFDVDLGAGYFRVPTDRWEAFQLSTDALLVARGRRVQARSFIREFGWDGDFDEVGVGAGVLALY